ncbi:MAG: NAD(P)-dependent oxidoreductase [Acidobacteria bacterium]|nr:NAD(P)-dependent oxidoreductase [Acidobacteriota bacterium]
MTDNNQLRSTIGILYPGEMGASFGKLLCEAGFRVITTVKGRSPRTRHLCHKNGLSAVELPREVLERSDVVISLVSPGAALSVARDVAAHLEGSSRRLLYLDANSISPLTVAQISEALGRVPVDFVDGSIFGLASQLGQRGTLYLSGARASELSAQFESIMRVKVVGDMPGQASALKMIVSGIPKGLSALFIETMMLAQNMHLLNEAMESCDEIYPSIMEVVRRMLPTYPQHAARRCEELKEVEETMLSSGLSPRIVHAVRELTSALANADWPERAPQQWTIAEVIGEIHKQRILQSQFTERQSPDGEGFDEQPIIVGNRGEAS